MLGDESHYLALAAAFCRGRLGDVALADRAAIDAGLAAGLKLHRFKRTAELPRVRRVVGALRGLAPGSLLDVGTGRGVFLWPLIDAMPEVEVLAIDWLALVAEADARGRRCRDPRDQEAILDKTALFVELAAEAGVLDRAWQFPSEHTRFVALRDERRAPDVLVHDDTRSEVVVMSGLPGAGKDAWLAAHRPELPVIALDDIRAELEVDPADRQGAVIAAARERARGYLRRGEPFAWNATNVSRRLRSGLVEFLAGYPVRVHLVYLEVAAAEQERRNRERDAVVPRAALARILDRWAPPTPGEAHRVSHVVDQPGPVAWPPP